MILVLDNYDSFTYNIVQYLRQLHVAITVCKNDAITLADIADMQTQQALQAIVLGPGPGTPDAAGITLACIAHFAGQLPMLGICLGHQAIAQAFGANIIRADKVMHGRTSAVYHQQQGLFLGLPNPTTVTRYHSLLVDKTTLPATLEVTAWTAAAANAEMVEIMAIRHRHLPIVGVQFHPESILSESGLLLLQNFLNQFLQPVLSPKADLAANLEADIAVGR